MLKLENVSKFYYSKTNVTVGLEKINLTLSKGEFVAITGESGSGKTTLLNVISGQDSYESGEYYFNDLPTSYYDAADWETYRRENIGFIFQNYNLIDSYTVLENVESVLWIKGYNIKEAKTKALHYIEEVGLTERKNHLATKLSSGQKQRLSIARALAKECELIIADEPTGNLDSENGKQIMELLSHLAKNKCVLVVTHNIEEALPYLTRQIRLSEGKIISDEIIHASTVSTSFSPTEIKQNKKVPFYFAGKNIIAQPRKTILFCFFTLFVAIASFVFFGNFISNIDDTSTKEYDDSVFKNGDETRIVSQKKDKTALSSQDMAFFLSLKEVEEIEPYNFINDINYFWQKDFDYAISYHTQFDEQDEPNSNSITFLKWNNFMRSVPSLKEDSLIQGRLTNSYLEVVISSSDTKLLGKTIDFYFNNEKEWGPNYFIKKTLTIVGLVNGNTNQVFFDEVLAKNMEMTCMNVDNYLHLAYYSTNGKQKALNITPTFTINNDLADNELRLSSDFYINHALTSSSINLNQTCLYYKQLNSTSNYSLLTNLTISPDGNDSSEKVIEVNAKTYQFILGQLSSTQLGIFISDYAYTKDTITTIKKNGYEAISPYKIGSIHYSDKLVQARLITLGVSLLFLILVYFLELVIFISLLKFKKNDYVILKTMGMKQTTVNQINYLEILFYDIFSTIVSILIMHLCSLCHFEYISNLIKYYRFYHYLILFVMNTIVLFITATKFNRYLYRKMKITALKED